HWLLISAPATQGPCMVSPTAAGPALHLPIPSSRLVALGNVKVGPMPQMNSFEPDGERKKLGLMSPIPVAWSMPGARGGWFDDGHDGARDEVPVVRQLDGHHRLDVQDPDAPVLRAGVEVEVVLERHADQVRYRVLRLLGEVRVAL